MPFRKLSDSTIDLIKTLALQRPCLKFREIAHLVCSEAGYEIPNTTISYHVRQARGLYDEKMHADHKKALIYLCRSKPMLSIRMIKYQYEQKTGKPIGEDKVRKYIKVYRDFDESVEKEKGRIVLSNGKPKLTSVAGSAPEILEHAIRLPAISEINTTRLVIRVRNKMIMQYANKFKTKDGFKKLAAARAEILKRAKAGRARKTTE